MRILELDNVSVAGVCACLPPRSEDSLARCRDLHGGDAEKADSVVKATGIRRRRLADAGVSSLDLCVRAAEDLLDARAQRDGVDPAAYRRTFGAVLCVTFTPERAMPCNACRAQHLLGMPSDLLAFDVGLACSGYAYGLYLAGRLARDTGRNVLLLDGDVQSAVTAPNDAATVPVLADAGTATIVTPSAAPDAAPWRFAFLTDGADGDALTLPRGGTIQMDGFAVFRFVALETTRFLKDFMSAAAITPDAFDAFVPHQANVYMIRQLAKSLKIPPDKLLVSGDEVGNSASATVPVTLALRGRAPSRLFLSGFGGGLSAAAARLDLPPSAVLRALDFSRPAPS